MEETVHTHIYTYIYLLNYQKVELITYVITDS